MIRTAFVTLVAGLVFFTVLVINDDWVRDRFATPFSFGKPEMFRVLESLNRQPSWEFLGDGRKYKFSVRLRPKPGVDAVRHRAAGPAVFSNRAFACGSRTFYETASACVDTTALMVVGTVTLRDVSASPPRVVFQDVPVTGALDARGKQLGKISLALSVADGRIVLWSLDARRFRVSRVVLPQVIDSSGQALEFSGSL